jgi:hypothetical protein
MSHMMGMVEGVFKECMENIDAGIPNTTPVVDAKETHKKVWVNIEFIGLSYGRKEYKCKEITEEMAKGCSSAVQVSVPLYEPVNKSQRDSHFRRLDGVKGGEGAPIEVPSADVQRFMSVILRSLGKDLYCPPSAQIILSPELRGYNGAPTGVYDIKLHCKEEHYSGQSFCSTCHALRRIGLAIDRSEGRFPVQALYDISKAVIRKPHATDPNRALLTGLSSTVIELHRTLVQTAFGTRSYYQDHFFDYQYIPVEACAWWLTKNKPPGVETLRGFMVDTDILGTIEAIKAQKGKVPKGLKEDRYIAARDKFLTIVKILKSVQAKLDKASSDTASK